jgi:hypothetical protein
MFLKRMWEIPKNKYAYLSSTFWSFKKPYETKDQMIRNQRKEIVPCLNGSSPILSRIIS